MFQRLQECVDDIRSAPFFHGDARVAQGGDEAFNYLDVWDTGHAVAMSD
ncbi:MAG: hypothetical protein Q7W05_08825 [Deltaproteobacteria bacterium]|nr:hypothetical protein [Deltaproteobacteria bacterium]